MVNRKIIDIHTHIFPDRLAEKAAERITQYYSLPREGDGTAAGLLKGGENFFDIKYIISSAAIKPEYVKNNNDFLLQSARENPLFIPLCSFHPFMDEKEGINELVRAKNEGARGVKLHPDFQSFDIDEPRAFPFYRACAQLSLPILFHVGDEKSDFSSPRRLYNILNKFDGLTIVAAHMCGYKQWELAQELLIGTPIYTETSEAFPTLSPEKLLELIRRHGADRVMFGSDYPLNLTSTTFAAIDLLPLSEDEKEKIFFGTAKKVFNIT